MLFIEIKSFQCVWYDVSVQLPLISCGYLSSSTVSFVWKILLVKQTDANLPEGFICITHTEREHQSFIQKRSNKRQAYKDSEADTTASSHSLEVIYQKHFASARVSAALSPCCQDKLAASLCFPPLGVKRNLLNPVAIGVLTVVGASCHVGLTRLMTQVLTPTIRRV